MSALLQVRDLAVAISTEEGIARILDRVNLTIGRGEVVGLVGESGCGKTTLARTIMGLLPSPAARIDSGEVLFDDTDLLALSADEMNTRVRGSRITFIPQDPFGSLNPIFRVGNQLAELMKWKSPRRRPPAGGRAARLWPDVLRRYPRESRGADREAILRMLDDIQIPQPAAALRKYPHEFSGGQRQRLLIAMAMLPQPELIIADEPTTALDVTTQAQILVLLRRLVNERGISVLFTTHDLGTASEICDRIIVLYAGQDVESAPIRGFFTTPAHPYTQRLLDSLPSPEHELRDIPGQIPSLLDAPPGCRFHPRCTFAQPDCAAARPGETWLDAAHAFRCFHPPPVAVQTADRDREVRP